MLIAAATGQGKTTAVYHELIKMGWKPDMWEAYKMTALSLADWTETIIRTDRKARMRDEIHLNYGGHGLKVTSARRVNGGQGRDSGEPAQEGRRDLYAGDAQHMDCQVVR